MNISTGDNKAMIFLLKSLKMLKIFSFSSRLFVKISPFGSQNERKRGEERGREGERKREDIRELFD
jgi:hypothetical protein